MKLKASGNGANLQLLHCFRGSQWSDISKRCYMLTTLLFFKGGGGLAQIKPLTGYGSCLIHKNRNRTTLFNEKIIIIWWKFEQKKYYSIKKEKREMLLAHWYKTELAFVTKPLPYQSFKELFVVFSKNNNKTLVFSTSAYICDEKIKGWYSP